MRKLQHTIDLSQANNKLAMKTALGEFVALVSGARAQEILPRETLQLCYRALVQQLDFELLENCTCNGRTAARAVQASGAMYTHIAPIRVA